MLGFDITFQGYESTQVSLNSPPISGPVPLYLRFGFVDLTASDIFAKYQHELLAQLKRLESAFVDCGLYVRSRRGDPFTTRRSFLYFLKSHLLPLFPKCKMYYIYGHNLLKMSENEVEQEPLLLLPQLYNTDGIIYLSFSFTSTSKSGFEVIHEDASAMISVQEVISWLHRPNRGNTSKSRKLKLGDQCFSWQCKEEEILVEIKTRLLEIFSTATLRCPYKLKIDFYYPHSANFKDVFVAANDNTGEELKIQFKRWNNGEGVIFERKILN